MFFAHRFFHRTLYVKQSYTSKDGGRRQPKDFPGYVEAVPEFYARLQASNRLTGKVLSQMNVLNEATKQQLDETDKLLAKLLELSKKEVENQPLTAADAEWIKHFDSAMKVATCGHRAEAMKTTLIADVHTDSNTQQVLKKSLNSCGVTSRSSEVRLLLSEPRPLVLQRLFSRTAGVSPPCQQRLLVAAWPRCGKSIFCEYFR
ncbi:MAG: DUF3160 domain-containing protein [Planctomycetota bacterium]